MCFPIIAQGTLSLCNNVLRLLKKDFAAFRSKTVKIHPQNHINPEYDACRQVVADIVGIEFERLPFLIFKLDSLSQVEHRTDVGSIEHRTTRLDLHFHRMDIVCRFLENKHKTAINLLHFRELGAGPLTRIEKLCQVIPEAFVHGFVGATNLICIDLHTTIQLLSRCDT